MKLSGAGDAPMKWGVVIAMSATNFTQGVFFTLPFAVAVFMVRGWEAQNGGAGEVFASAGALTGILAGCYSFAQCTTQYAWGAFSDKYGRKPVMLIASGSLVVSAVWFGFAGSFAQAAGARVLGGLLNGVPGAWKCILAEGFTLQQQSRVMGFFTLCWGVGSIAGPALGGALSQPCSVLPSLPGCEPGGLLQIRPYCLPCLLAALLNLIALVVKLVMLEETLPSIVEAGARSRRRSAMQAQRAAACRYSRLAAADAEGQQQAAGSCRLDVAACLGDADDRQQEGTWWEAGAALLRSSSSVLFRYQRLPSADGCQRLPSTDGCQAAAPGGQDMREPVALDGSLDAFGADSSSSISSISSGGSISSGSGGGNISSGSGGGNISSSSGGGSFRSIGGSYQTAARQQAPAALPASSASSAGASCSEIELRCMSGSDTASCGNGQGADTGQGAAQGWAGGDQGVPAPPSDSSSSSSPAPRDQQQYGHPWLKVVGWKQQQQRPSADGAAEPEWKLRAGWEGRHLLPEQQPPKQEQQQEARLDLERQCSSLTDLSISSDVHSSSPAGPLPPWYHDRQLVAALAGFTSVCLLHGALDELFPIFASAPLSEGGLAMSEAQLAVPLAFHGACLIVWAMLIYPPAQQALGTLRLTRVALACTAPVALAVALPSLAPVRMPRLEQVLLLAAMAVKAAVMNSAFTGAIILVNSKCHRQQLGKVNAVGAVMATFVRGCGPTASGLAWAAALKLHWPGLQQFVPFGIVSGLALLAWALYLPLHPDGSTDVQQTPPCQSQKGVADV